MKFLLVTDQKWVASKIPAIHTILALCPDLKDVEIAIKFQSLVPEVKDGRIPEAWFQENITKHAAGYDGAVFIASEAQGKKWSLQDGLRGSHLRDDDKFIECWAVSNEKSTVRYKNRSKRDRLPKVVCHELGHGFEHIGYTKLDVHQYDFENQINNLEGFYKTLKLEGTDRRYDWFKALLESLKPAPPKVSNRENLYQVAYDCLGKDMAKTQQELGCAESVSAVMRLAGVPNLPAGDITGTWTLEEWLKRNLKEVPEPLPGDIIISATGTGNGKLKNGHTGIVGKHSIMSNNYKTYLFDWHLTLEWWKEYYGKKGGFPVRYYRWV